MYKKMYYRLFNAITEAMGHILRMEYGEAYGILARAKRRRRSSIWRGRRRETPRRGPGFVPKNVRRRPLDRDKTACYSVFDLKRHRKGRCPGKIPERGRRWL